MPDTIISTRRLRAFRNEGAAANAGRWVAAVAGHAASAKWAASSEAWRLERAATEGLNTAGGFLVPVELARAIFAMRETYGVFRRTAQYAPMGRDNTAWPKRGGGLTAYFAGEGTAVTESTMALGALSLTARKIGVLARVTAELDEDSAIEIGDLFAEEMAYALAAKEDACAFIGDGGTTYDGIKGAAIQLVDGSHDAGKVAAASGHNTFAEIDAADIANLMAKLPAVALPGARWFISQFGFATVFCRLAAATGGILAMADANGRVMPHFMGWPVELTQSLPQAGTDLAGSVMLLFGDMRLAGMLGERRTLTIARSDAPGFADDLVMLKATERVDINVHNLGDNTNAGPLIGLVGTT